jgi:DNA-binding XRE family transcriptional regulator
VTTEQFPHLPAHLGMTQADGARLIGMSQKAV